MKMKKLMIATAAVVLSSQAMGQAFTGTLSEATAAPGDSYAGAMPVGIVANPLLRNALQAAQLDPACVGNDSKTCMPSISTVELTTIMAAGFGDEWGANYGITAFGTGAGASPVTCEIGPGGPVSEAARVAARHVGYGCTPSNPDGLLSGLQALFGIAGDVAACLTTVESTFAAGGIGFAPADSQNAAYRFVKLDGQSPDLDNFAAGNYAMFGDIHGTQNAATVTQPWGVAGSIASAANPPMHADSGNFNVSNECAAGTLRNRTGGDLVN